MVSCDESSLMMMTMIFDYVDDDNDDEKDDDNDGDSMTRMIKRPGVMWWL